MTRAAQRLIVVGHHGVNGPAEDNWHELVSAGLGELLRPAPAPWDASETILSFGAPPRGDERAGPAPTPAPVVEPDWLRRPATPEAPLATLSPSRAAAPRRRADEGGRERRQAGALAHALLQRLPDVAPPTPPRRGGELSFCAERLDRRRRASAARRALRSRSSRFPFSRRCSPPARAPKWRSPAPLPREGGTRAAVCRPHRPTRGRRRRDLPRRLQDAARSRRAPTRPLMSRSSRSIARRWRRSIPTGRSAPSSFG